jgi:hypothetical protein
MAEEEQMNETFAPDPSPQSSPWQGEEDAKRQVTVV